jgi:succinoglycan biosynthesis transport protein ExoP
MEEKRINDEIDLQKYWLVIKRNWKAALGAFSIVISAALITAFSEKPVYEAEAKILVKSNRSTSLTGLAESLGRIETLTYQANPLDTQVEIIQSNTLLQSVIEDLNLVDEEGALLKVKDLSSNLTVKSIRGADVISVAYVSNDSQMAANVANEVANTFIENSIQDNRLEATSARDFIAAQLPKTEADLNRAEQNLRRFKESNQIVSLEQEAQLLVDAFYSIKRQIESIESQVSSIESTIKTYQDQLNISDPQFAIVLAAVNQSEGVQQVLRELQTVEEEIAKLRSQFTDESQVIIKLNTSRENLHTVLQQRIDQVVNDRPFLGNSNLQIGIIQSDVIAEIVSLDAQKQGLINQVGTLSNQIDTYQQRMSVLPQLESTQSELQRELEVAKNTYQTLLARFQELQVAESQNIGTARVISPALVPEEPVDSKKKLIIVSGMVAGTLLGIFVAFTLDLFSHFPSAVNETRKSLLYKDLGSTQNINITGEEDYM